MRLHPIESSLWSTRWVGEMYEDGIRVQGAPAVENPEAGLKTAARHTRRLIVVNEQLPSSATKAPLSESSFSESRLLMV